MSKKGDVFSEVPEIVLGRTFSRLLPSFFSLVVAEDGRFIELKLYSRGLHDMLAVCKRYGPDGGPQVIFGSGSSLSSCLLAIEGAVSAGRWRTDVPWKDRQG